MLQFEIRKKFAPQELAGVGAKLATEADGVLGRIGAQFEDTIDHEIFAQLGTVGRGEFAAGAFKTPSNFHRLVGGKVHGRTGLHSVRCGLPAIFVAVGELESG